VEVGVLVPVTAYQAGDALAGVDAPSKSGVEAVRLGAKVHILGSGKSGPSLGAALLAAIPTGSAGGLVREDGWGAEARALGGLRAGDYKVSLGAGVRLRESTRLYDIALGNELTFAASVEQRLDANKTMFAELAGATPLADPGASKKQTPLELLLGARGRDGDLMLVGAIGTGLTEGYGTPILRFVLGASWSNARPEARPAAPAAAAAPAPAAPKPDADTDKDGIPDSRDKCRTEPATKNGYQDEDGCPDKNPHDVDTDGDGLMDDVDKCPKDPEDKDGFEDDDGCPDPDNDKDGIPDVNDKCPTQPETINNVKDDDGCPDKGLVTLKENELETLRPIFFDKDRARVRQRFHASLDDIAAILKAHPEIGRCAVEGHTDATGPAEWNKKLSLARAKSVAVYLISKGVDPARVVAIGQAEALPWASNQTEAGRAANRRVIFHIEGISEDQDKKQLELQRQRGLQQTGAPPVP
jgi:outer membrane protein OmpA-like peptidoglycan-associated protein